MATSGELSPGALLRGGLGMLVALSAVAASGCAVGQAPGRGRTLHLQERTTGGWYWLYLPQGYDDPVPPGARRPKRPLVMTFHGMKPFDSDNSQIREWQQEADRYGFVVCAPDLSVSALLGPVPLNQPDHPSLKRDERAVIAIMNEVYQIADVDPNRVLATSWSYGGYVAHYMANRYPERFSCIAVKQSNFNADLLDPANVPRYRDHKVAIYYTENDFALCRRESRAAAEWYARHGFDLTFGVFEKKGHERTPGVAAEFFARICGAEARTPPIELARMQIKLQQLEDVPTAATTTRPEIIPRLSQARRSAGSAATPARLPHDVSTSSSRRVVLRSEPVLPLGRGPSAKQVVPPVGLANEGPVRIRLSTTIGVAPLLVGYSALLPKSIRKDAHLLWTDQGEPLSNGLHGQKVFTEPGDHSLELLVTTPNGTEYRSSRTITVIERVSKVKP
ncbi:MAG: PHB depolymerase family esterase [Phycisphaerae bacterium]